jgi:hypothetical protein
MASRLILFAQIARDRLVGRFDNQKRSNSTAKKGGLRGMLIPPNFNPRPHRRERRARSFQSADAGCLYFEIAARSAAALRPRVAESRTDKALLFEPVQSAIQSSHGNGAPGSLFDLPPNWNAIRFVTQPHQREKDNLLKLTKKIAGRHY